MVVPAERRARRAKQDSESEERRFDRGQGRPREIKRRGTSIALPIWCKLGVVLDARQHAQHLE